LYLGALFDLYSIDGTTLGVDGAAAAMSGRAFPTAFQTGFTVELPSELTEARLVLLDVSGRIVREQRMSPGSQWVSREGLASGAYRASVRDAQGTPLIDLGTLIAE
jgi:hypothetical protein